MHLSPPLLPLRRREQRIARRAERKGQTTGVDPERWIEEIRGGSYTAFAAMFRAYYDPLLSFASVLLHSQEAAEEVVQDVFYNIWRNHEVWEVRRNLRSYLYVAVRNAASKEIRHQRVAARWEEESQYMPPRSSVNPQEELEASELKALVRRAVEQMPERQRLVFVLSRRHGLSYGEVASVLGISVNTVKVQMVRALKGLRASLGPYL